jgi:hypothetical protein
MTISCILKVLSPYFYQCAKLAAVLNAAPFSEVQTSNNVKYRFLLGFETAYFGACVDLQMFRRAALPQT